MLVGMRRAAAVITIVLAVACTRAGGDGSATASTEGPLPPISATEPGGRPITFDQYQLSVRSPDGSRSVRFSVYDADDHSSRARGLMQVRDLPAGGGMLFRFGRPQDGGFWMKNTLIPLSIAFADSNGAIVDVLQMQPCEADPCPIYRPDAQYEYALEVNQGAFAEQGIAEGWTLVVPDDLPPAD